MQPCLQQCAGHESGHAGPGSARHVKEPVHDLAWHGVAFSCQPAAFRVAAMLAGATQAEHGKTMGQHAQGSLIRLHARLACLPQVRIMTPEGKYVLSHMDEVVDDMLNKDHMFDIALPRLPARSARVFVEGVEQGVPQGQVRNAMQHGEVVTLEVTHVKCTSLPAMIAHAHAHASSGGATAQPSHIPFHLYVVNTPPCPSHRRLALEKAGQLDPRVSVLDEEFDEEQLAREAVAAEQEAAAAAQEAGGAGSDGEARKERERRWALVVGVGVEAEADALWGFECTWLVTLRACFGWATVARITMLPFDLTA